MSVLNQMLRDLQARGEPMPAQALQNTNKNAADPYNAGAIPVMPSLLPINNLQRWDKTRVVLWSLTALVAAGFLGGLQWQKRQAIQAAMHVRPPLGYAEFKGAINTNLNAPLAAAPMPATAITPAALETEVAEAPTLESSAPVLADTETAVASTAVAATVTPQAVRDIRPSAAAPAARGTTRAAEVLAPKSVAEAPTQPLNSQANTQLALAAPSSRELPVRELPAREVPENTVRPSSASINNPEATVARAADLIARGRNIDAALLLRQTLTLQPRHVDARRALAALQSEAGQQDAALVTLLEGAQVDPARFAPMAAALQVELGNAQGALATLARIPLEVQTAQHHALAAGIAQRIGAHEDAVAAFRRALTVYPQEPAWWIGLAVSLEALGQRTDAQAAYERATVIPTTSTELREFAVQKLSQLALSPAH